MNAPLNLPSARYGTNSQRDPFSSLPRTERLPECMTLVKKPFTYQKARLTIPPSLNAQERKTWTQHSEHVEYAGTSMSATSHDQNLNYYQTDLLEGERSWFHLCALEFGLFQAQSRSRCSSITSTKLRTAMLQLCLNHASDLLLGRYHLYGLGEQHCVWISRKLSRTSQSQDCGGRSSLEHVTMRQKEIRVALWHYGGRIRTSTGGNSQWPLPGCLATAGARIQKHNWMLSRGTYTAVPKS